MSKTNPDNIEPITLSDMVYYPFEMSPNDLIGDEKANFEAVKAVCTAFHVQICMSFQGFNNFKERALLVSPKNLIKLLSDIMKSDPGIYLYDGYGGDLSSYISDHKTHNNLYTYMIYQDCINVEVNGRTSDGHECAKFEDIEYTGPLTSSTKNAIAAIIAVCKAFKVDLVITSDSYAKFLKTLSDESLVEHIERIMYLEPKRYEFDGSCGFTPLEAYNPLVDGVMVPLEGVKRNGSWIYPISELSFQDAPKKQVGISQWLESHLSSGVDIFCSVEAFKKIVSPLFRLNIAQKIQQLSPGRYEMSPKGDFIKLE